MIPASSSFPIYRQHNTMLFVALVIVLVFVSDILFLGVSEIAFTRIGFSSQEFLGILILTLIGSMINIPVRRYTKVLLMVSS
ncbi:MAG TPA: hypothetical protein VNE86_08100 [Nitrososphaerales archaeon]|nr:hypothetical protein [Nitrososphaerales archaeon]